jgi:hypothetical protein
VNRYHFTLKLQLQWSLLKWLKICVVFTPTTKWQRRKISCLLIYYWGLCNNLHPSNFWALMFKLVWPGKTFGLSFDKVFPSPDSLVFLLHHAKTNPRCPYKDKVLGKGKIKKCTLMVHQQRVGRGAQWTNFF